MALAAAIGAATVASAAAQPVIGFRLGLSMAKASIESPDLEEFERSWLMGFTGGGFIRFGAGSVALQPELLYVTKGVKFDDPEGTDAEVKFKLDYIEVPVLLFLGLSSAYVVVGPAFAFEAACSFEGEGDGTSVEFDCDDPEFGEFERKKFDVGAMFGAGLAFPAGPGSLIVDGRFNLGVMNIIDDETNNSFKHRTLYFTAGYQIPLGIR
jgi:hypothetical protein